MKKWLALGMAVMVLCGCTQTSTTSSSSSSGDTSVMSAEEIAASEKAYPLMAEKNKKNKLIYADACIDLNLAADVQGEDYFSLSLNREGFKDKYNVDLTVKRDVPYTFAYDDTEVTKGTFDFDDDSDNDSDDAGYGYDLNPVEHQDQSKVSRYVLALDIDGEPITLEMPLDQ